MLFFKTGRPGGFMLASKVPRDKFVGSSPYRWKKIFVGSPRGQRFGVGMKHTQLDTSRRA